MAHPVRRFSKGILIFSNIAVGICFLIGCYGYWFDPIKLWFVGFLTLGSLYLLVVLVLFFFFWMLVKPPFMLITLVSIALAWQPLQQLVKVKNAKTFAMTKPDNQLRVMSWNIEHFEILSHKTHPEKKLQMLSLINVYKPDVACFQEVVAGDSSASAINYLPDLKRELNMPFHYFSYNPKLDFDKDHRFGIIIFSKYPLVGQKTISHKPNDYNSIFQYVDVLKDSDTFRVFNLHLQSLRFSTQDRAYLDEPSIDDETNFAQSKNIVYKFKIGFLKRKKQSDYIRQEVDKSPYPVIVCGDFNDVPNSYAYHTIGEGLQNAYAEAGTGIGRTFSGIAPTLRIDNIFADKRFTVSQFVRHNKKMSDHFPIVADLYYNKP